MNYTLHIKMGYSIKPKNRINLNGYGFLSFPKKMGKNISNKFSQNLLDTAKKSITDAIKTASKRSIKKIAEATRDLVGHKITSASKKSTKELPDDETEVDVEIAAPRKIFISPEKRQQIIDELKLV